MSLKLYYNLMSQPSRALYILLKTAKCNFEPKAVNLMKGEHFSEEFAAINRFQKVPAINHNGFSLSESVAIIKYLARENLIPETLYPKESKLQARVDEFLEWQHIELRLHCAMYFRTKYLDPIMFGKKNDEKSLEGYTDRMETALEKFDTLWLNNGTEYIAGNTITVADLLAACEIEQPRMAGYNPADHFEGISKWSKKVQEYFNPHYDEAHVILNKVVNKAKSAAKL
ncbi:glutathione S-transferase theta-1-like [Vanessa cardui]|uniref:glutathione S-transferase theta-1-like n=1 Tax=Vanessa cardui TaxID=171605 RepID=UPI001F143521|nr:glutathione S-transferase theta-1-like [Vanessa cardui]XP_046966201.1 glutathione S-transferase theta-1-like [Vanessa cardui]XP_046966202.1 glutathione S-transferase theta-1-like [Vanessa cardui]XP_046966203.1 glutathione S-transferase theta-1-like [Vanessa cardui]